MKTWIQKSSDGWLVWVGPYVGPRGWGQLLGVFDDEASAKAAAKAVHS